MVSRTSGKKIETGQEVVAFCGKCKADSDHIISAMENDTICKVMCRTCGAQHNYRKPKSLVEDKVETKPLKKPKSPSPARKSHVKAPPSWTDFIANYDLSTAKDYHMEQDYQETSVIRHSVFGIGIVTKRISSSTIEVRFESAFKLLVINRKV